MSGIVPTQDNLNDWTLRTKQLASQADALGLHHDLYTVVDRIEVEHGRHRTIQGGCAYRVMRLAKRLREFDVGVNDEWLRELGDEQHIEAISNASVAAYDLAFELIQHECSPSPGWKTICEEMGFAHKEAAANDY